MAVHCTLHRPRVPDFGPISGKIEETLRRVFKGWGQNAEDPPVLVCLAGCPRTPHYLPRPLDVDVTPSSLVPHHTVWA